MNDDTATRRVADRAPSAPDQGDIATRRVGAAGARPAAAALGPHDISTRRVGEARAGAEPEGPLGSLQPGTVLCGNCVVVRTRRNHESERPGLFECNAPEGRVMVKLAAVEHPPHPALWGKLASFRHEHVLRVHRTLKEGSRYYEVQEFCSGGTLEDLVPMAGSGRPTPPLEWIERVLLPAFLGGINYLHEAGVIHRDVKPSNIYFRESHGKRTMVLGDFDISAALETGRTSRATQRAAGTWNYSAPEAFPRFVDDEATKVGSAISRAGDYYSFGVVLVELLTGTTSLHQAQFPDLFDFYLQGGRVEIPAGLPPRISELLQGLLLRNRKLRWGHAEVSRWISGTTTEADRQRIREDGGYRLGVSTAPFTAFEHSKPTNLRELAEAMQREPGVAADELLSSDVLLNWIGNLDSKIARQIRKGREQWRHFPQLAYIHAGRLIAPDMDWPLRVAKRKVHNAAEWAGEAPAAVNDGLPVADLCGHKGLTQLELWLRHKADPETDMADAVAAIRDASAKDQTPPTIVMEELGYAFMPGKAYVAAPGVVVRSPGEFSTAVYGQPKEWEGHGSAPSPTYAAAMKKWQAGSLEAWLRQRLNGNPDGKRLVDQCAATRRKFADAPFAGFETVLRLLNPALPPVMVEIDAATLQPALQVDHGKNIERTVTYHVRGPGMPYGAWKLDGALPGLQLEHHQIKTRTGDLTVKLESANQIPPDKTHQATLKLEGRFVRLVPDEVPLTYRVRKGFTFNPVWFQGRVMRAAAIFAAALVFLGLAVRSFVLARCSAWLNRPLILQGQTATISGAAFSPDGKSAITSSYDGTVNIWPLNLGPDTVSGNVRAIWGELSSNPDRHVTASKSIHNGRSIATMAISPDGNTMALSSGDDQKGTNQISIWNLGGNTTGPVQTVTGNDDSYNEIETVNFSHKGDWLAAGYRNGTIETWNTKGWSLGSTWTGHYGSYAGVKHVEFSPDDTKLASASDDSSVALWNVPGQNQRYAVFHGENQWCRAAALSPQGSLLAMGNDAYVLHVFDWNTRRRVGSYTYHTDRILCLAFSPDGKLLASGGQDALLAIWDTSTWAVKLALREREDITSVAFSPDGNLLLSGEKDGTSKVWQLKQLGLR